MPGLVLLWIWLCALLNCAGWGLSALHQLNAAGYAVVLLAMAAGFWVWRKPFRLPGRPDWRKTARRFRRGLPLWFLLLSAVALVGGLLYAPTNYDGLAYRTPRVLHWLAEGRWHWIHTVFPRVNGRACGYEWLCTPLVALLNSDRGLFLINLVSFLLMPGLIFSVFTRLGVRPRVAWHWMWVVPTGYGFLLQAGSIGNDLFGVPFVLAAMDFALRANRSRQPRDVFAAVLAAALMTGAKTSNLPLLLPWAVAIVPVLGLVRRSLLPAVLVGVVAVFASVLPILVFNYHYYHGDWAGLSPEGDNKKGHLVLRTVANTALMTAQNLVPPVFPMANAWNEAVPRLLPPGLHERLLKSFAEPPAAECHVDQMAMEEAAGLGMGVSLLLLASVLAAFCQVNDRPGVTPRTTGFTRWQTSLRWLPLVSLLALLSQSQVSPLARILVPYYALLLPLWLALPGQTAVVRRRWWHGAEAGIFWLAALVLIISPARPLFPAQTVVSALSVWHPGSALVQRTSKVYTVYHDRSQAFAPALAELPPGLKVLGLFTYDDPETSLWLPFGSRRVVHVCPEDTADFLNHEGIQYVLLDTLKMKDRFNETPAEWVNRLNGTVVKQIPLTLRVSEGTVDWWLVKLP
jgi:hypothetical protein